MLSFIQKYLSNESKIRDRVASAREKCDADTDFISELVNEKYGSKSMADMYELLSRIDMPGLTNDSLKILDIKDEPDLAPIFLQDAWGLFNHAIRASDAQSVEMKHIREQKISRTITVIHLLSRLGTLITDNINHKKAATEHERYYDTVRKMMDEKHLDIQNLATLKATEFGRIITYIDTWLNSSIFKEKSPTLNLDMKRHHMFELIRQEAYNALEQQCKHPVNNVFVYDELNASLMTDTRGNRTMHIVAGIRDRLDDNITIVLSAIDTSPTARTAFERSYLKQTLLKGYMDIIDFQVSRGAEKYIDVVIHPITVGRVLRLAYTIKDHIRKEDMEKVLSHCLHFEEGKTPFFRDSIHPLTAAKWIVFNQRMGSLIMGSLISGGIITMLDDADDASDFSKWLRMSSSIVLLVGIFLMMYGYYFFGYSKYSIGDLEWAQKFISYGEDHNKMLAKQILRDEKDHNKSLAKIQEEMNLIRDRAAEEEKLNAEKNSDSADGQEERDKIVNEALKKVEEQLEKQRHEMIQAEKQRKEELKKKHESLHSNKGSEWTKKKKNVHEVDIPPPAVPPVNAFIPVHQVPAPAVAAPPPKVAFEPIVVFGYDDPLRNVFINHVKTIMRITQAPIKQQKDNPTLEDLAAMKYDVLQFCEHLTAIHSREGCNQKQFVETLMRAQDIPLINQLRNGLVHNDSVLTDPEKFSLYHDTLELLSVIGTLHRHGDIQSNALCAQAIARKDDFPVRINFSETTRPLVDRLIAPQQRMVVNPALIHAITQRQAYLNIICERYLSASSKEETALLSKVLLITIAELGEIYKEIFVHQKLEREFRAMYPTDTIDNRMVDRFINVRRDIVHIQDPKAGDVGVILSSEGSIFKQNASLKIGII